MQVGGTDSSTDGKYEFDFCLVTSAYIVMAFKES